MPESPHMIRCSTCNSQVPLIDLSDHICKPSAATTTNALLPPPRQASAAATQHQHSRLASGFSHDTPPTSQLHASRNMLNPLRVNISHAPQNGQFEARESRFAFPHLHYMHVHIRPVLSMGC